MPRLTISLDEDQHEWLQAEADRQDRSKAYVLRELIDAHRTGEVSTDVVNTGEHETSPASQDEGQDHSEKDLVELVEDLRARLGDVEDAVGTDAADSTETPTDTEPTHTSEPREPAPDATVDGQSGAADEELLDDIWTWLQDNPPRKSHAKQAVIEVFRELREHGTLATSDLQEQVYPTVEEHYADARTMWNSLSRYLEDVPGVEKGDYGEWRYAGDAVARQELDT